MKTLILICILALTFAACTEAPPEVGRDESTLRYTDGGVPIAETQAEIEQVWREHTGCQVTPEQWLNAEDGKWYDAFNLNRGATATTDKPIIERKCSRKMYYFSATQTEYCDFCCTWITICTPTIGGCHTSESCGDEACDMIDRS